MFLRASNLHQSSYMAKQHFSRRQVERSFRKFNDIVADLFSSQHQTWGNVFTHLITHCEQDEVMRVVTEPLRTNKNVDAEKWLEDGLNSMTGMIGSGHYELPYDDDDRTALLYQLFLLIENTPFDFSGFCMTMFGSSHYQDMVHTFNQELVLKFTREVSYRLDEIMQDSGNQQEIPQEAMMVFHHHDNSINVSGNIQGSNVASGQANITKASATNTNVYSQADVLQTLKQARQNLASLPEAERQEAEVFADSIEAEVVSDNAGANNALVYAASLLPLLEKAGTALDVIQKFKTMFNL